MADFALSFPVTDAIDLKLTLTVDGGPFDLAAFLAAGGTATFRMQLATGSMTKRVVSTTDVTREAGDATNVATVHIDQGEIAYRGTWTATLTCGEQTWSGTATVTASGVPAVTAGGVTTFAGEALPASASLTGGVRLAGDLGGTATAPEVRQTHLSAPLPEAQGGTGFATVSSALVTATGSTTARSHADRAADVVNVKDWSNLAVGSDWSAAVAAAHAAAKAALKPLYFPPGTYVVDTISVEVWGRILGAGWGRTVLRPKDVNAPVIKLHRTASLDGYATEIRDLKIVGYSSGTGHGIEGTETASYDGAAMLRIDRVWIENVGGDGVHLEEVWSSELSHVIVNNCGGHAFYVKDAIITLHLNSCYAKGVPTAGKSGFRILHGFAKFTNCNGIDSGENWGTFGGLVADGDAKDGIVRAVFDGGNIEDFTSVGWRFKNNSRFESNGVHFFAPLAGTVIAVLIENTNTRMTNLWGPANDVESKGASWSQGYPMHATYAPAILKIGTPAGQWESMWHITAGYAIRVPTLLTESYSPGLRINGGIILSQDTSTGAWIRRHLSAAWGGWAGGTVNAGSYLTASVTVTGAELGDTAYGGYDQELPAGVHFTANVVAADTVRFTFRNETGGNVALPAGTLRADVWQH